MVCKSCVFALISCGLVLLFMMWWDLNVLPGFGFLLLPHQELCSCCNRCAMAHLTDDSLTKSIQTHTP